MKRPKYNTSTKKKDKPVYNGMVFDSKDELLYFEWLQYELITGKISGLERQIKFTLIDKFQVGEKKVRAAELIVDFKITLNDGTILYQDYKPNPSAKAELQRKLFESRYKTPLQWISYSKMDGGWIDCDELKKRRAKRKRMKNDKNK